MPEQTSLGQRAYAAWCAAYWGTEAVVAAAPWHVCSADYRAAWEAAAQAVLKVHDKETR